ARVQVIAKGTGQIAADFEAKKIESVPDAPAFQGIHIETTMVTERRSMFDARRPDSLLGPFGRILAEKAPILTCSEKCDKMACDRCVAQVENVSWNEIFRLCESQGQSAAECKVGYFNECFDKEGCDGIKPIVDF